MRTVHGTGWWALALVVGCGPVEPAGQPPAAPPSTAQGTPAAEHPVLAAYDQVHGALATDRLEEARAAGQRLAEAAQGAQEPALAALADAGRRIGDAADLAAARRAFADASQQVITWLEARPELADERHFFQCPMVEGYNRWTEPDAALQNPYMGAAMPTCGTKVELNN